jgi:hypothetical protein
MMQATVLCSCSIICSVFSVWRENGDDGSTKLGANCLLTVEYKVSILTVHAVPWYRRTRKLKKCSCGSSIARGGRR